MLFRSENLRDADGRWHRSWQADASPRARHDALAHDLAHVVDAFTRLYELTGNERWLSEARDAADELISRHWDDMNMGLFTTAHDGEKLIARQKDIMDNATPSANSTAALALLRLSSLLCDGSYADRATAILSLLARVQPQAPSAFCNAMHAFELAETGTTEVVIPGDNRDFMREYCSMWRPFSVIAHGRPTDGPLWEGRTEGNAYVCRGNVCLAPATTVTELAERLATSDPT